MRKIILLTIFSLIITGCLSNKLTAQKLTLAAGHELNIQCVWIKSGRFLMGSPVSDKYAGNDEKPEKEVEIKRGFYLGCTTITMAQFREFVNETGYETDAEKDGRGGHGFDTAKNSFAGWFPQYTWRYAGWVLTDEHPVGNVSWNDAIAFCKWFSEKSGKIVRLPTEAEWEYACRAGTTTIFFTGDNPGSLNGYANVPDEALRKKLNEQVDSNTWFPFNDGYAFTAPVAHFKPNPWGLYDMIGNVFEWCSDTFPNYSNRRVLRGGSYNLNIEVSRCASRGFAKREARYSYTGFRILVESESDKK
jgi:formylglycine-generating enzyme required for sulfatase activity